MSGAIALDGEAIAWQRLPACEIAQLEGEALERREARRLGVEVPEIEPPTCSLSARLQSWASERATMVEFAPGLGVTARMILKRKPRSYVGIEQNSKAAQWTARHLPEQPNISVAVGTADRTSLPAGSASVVLGEAMLSMQTPAHKVHIAAEAFRLLRQGGRYGIQNSLPFQTTYLATGRTKSTARYRRLSMSAPVLCRRQNGRPFWKTPAFKCAASVMLRCTC